MLSPQDYHSSVFYAESLYICHHPLNSKKTAGQDKKGFLNQQCEEIEENNEMGKKRSLQENWRYQGNISCKDGHYKGQKQQGSNRSKKKIKRGVKNTKNNYMINVLMTQITMMERSLT